MSDGMCVKDVRLGRDVDWVARGGHRTLDTGQQTLDRRAGAGEDLTFSGRERPDRTGAGTDRGTDSFCVL